MDTPTCIEEIPGELDSAPPFRKLQVWLAYNGKTMAWLSEQLGIKAGTLSQIMRAAKDEDAGRQGRPMSARLATRLEELSGIRWYSE